jgi:hypothetical protein
VRLAGSKAVPALLALGDDDLGQVEAELASLLAPAEARFIIAATRRVSEAAPQLLFLYFCPAEALVRQKMGYSVQKKAVVEQVEAVLGRPFSAVVEAQELADVASALTAPTAAAGDAGALEDGVSGAAGAAAGAGAGAVGGDARPKAPGRRGASTRVKTLLAKDEDD